MVKGTTINDSIHGMITLSAFERSVIYTPEFYRLHDIHQDSTLFMTYPTNRTMRYEHSIGTMKLGSDMFYNAILNAEDGDLEHFYKDAKTEIEKLIRELNKNKVLLLHYMNGDTIISLDNLLTNLKIDVVRTSFIPSNITGKEERLIQIILMETIRTGALLHDIGHPPFSHIIEHAISGSYEAVESIKEEKRTPRHKQFIKDLQTYFTPEEGETEVKALHEKMGDTISDNLLTNVIDFYFDNAQEKSVTETCFALIIKECVLAMFCEKPFFTDLHRIIDSSVDCDRLDYVTRDLKNSGIDCGTIDYPRITNNFKMICKDGRYLFCFPVKSVNIIEDFLKRRFNLYKDIVFHHHAVKTDFLLESTVTHMILDYLNEGTAEQSSGSGEKLIPFDISGLWYPLTLNQVNLTKKSASNLLQWNDAWLLTVLKHLYYTKYISRSGEILTRQLDELLANQKSYYSFTKRMNEFSVLDAAVKDGLKDAEKLRSVINIHSKGLLCRKIQNNLSDLSLTKDLFKNLVKNAASAAASEIYGQNAIEDILIAWPNIKVGVGQPINFYKGDKLISLEELSGIKEVLEFEKAFIPPFYLYLMFNQEKSGEGDNTEKKNQFLILTGTKIADYLKK